MCAELVSWLGVIANNVKTVLLYVRNFELYKLGIFKR